MSGEAIVITGIGLRTAVGNDAMQTAAAVRAAVARFAAWEAGGVAAENAPGVIAAALPENLGDGSWIEKVDDLLTQPLHEAFWDAGLDDLVQLRARTRGQVGLYVATPYPDRPGVAKDAFRLFAIEAKQHCIAPAQADHVALVSYDHAAGIAAIQQAITELRAMKVDVAVVVGVDSLLHGEYLTALVEQGRLKLPDAPHGLLPGEAGAVLILERARDAKARKAEVRARIGALALEQERVPLGEAHPIRAEGASRAVNNALQADGRASQIHYVITDLSGERWRALEFALVETRCFSTLPRTYQIWHPADCIGDVGAASSVVHAALVARAFARGYAGPGGILMFAASARGERAAATLWPPSGAS
jgi:3-oxoacyl-[acyl-carrier-protein] synthase-1